MATATLDDPAHGEDAFRCIDSGYSSETAASSNDDGDEDDSADAGPGMCCIMPFVCVDPLGDWPALFFQAVQPPRVSPADRLEPAICQC